MSHGMEVYHSNGNLTYSSADVTWNQVDFFYVAAGGSQSFTYPALEGREVLLAQVFVQAPPSDRRAYAHTLTRSGNTVTASGGSEAAYILVLMR
ncbi:hypothetical protein [Flavobacterium sp.]|jgi:hypothetical protein|uniref:hypothetical protein n=1 Tax=Flavobacterium sp. TaxID=239 RepID=UPI0037BEBDFA